jgi:hypothetical protein
MRGERTLVARMLAWRLVLPILKRILPIRRLVRLMRMRRPSRGRLPGSAERIAEIAALVCRPRVLGSQDNCLERSLLAYRYMSAIGAGPELVIGIGRERGNTIGHAWVALDGKPVVESAASVKGFTQLMSFTGGGTVRSARASLL